MPDGLLDEISIIVKNDIIEENNQIFKNGDVPGKIFILTSGQVELYLKVKDGELLLDTLMEPGCVIN